MLAKFKIVKCNTLILTDNEINALKAARKVINQLFTKCVRRENQMSFGRLLDELDELTDFIETMNGVFAEFND